jgi:hypothetical protein
MKPTTKNNKKTNIHNKTRKNRLPKYIKKEIKTGFSIFSSKNYIGSELLSYQKKQALKTNNRCLYDNMTWFGVLEIAKAYKIKNSILSEFKFKKPTNLLVINKKNEDFFKQFFTNSKKPISSFINLGEKKINYEHPYLDMSQQEKAYYDFCFAFGYITVREQHEFMKLLLYLIENKFTNIYRRDGKTSIIETLYIKTGYYHLNQVEPKDKKYNRLSIYALDKRVITNLCKIVAENSLNISGVYQPNNHSFWFPKIIINRIQNIEEYILFNAYENLSFVKVIE